MTTDNAELLGQVIDKIDNLLGALELPLPNDMHLQGIRGNLPDVVSELRLIYRLETGENPWPKQTDEMTEEELDSLTEHFIGSNDKYADFQTFWSNFLGIDPNVSEMIKLLEKLQEWGYVVDQDGY